VTEGAEESYVPSLLPSSYPQALYYVTDFPEAASLTDCQVIFDRALEDYRERTGKTLLGSTAGQHYELRISNDILDILQAQILVSGHLRVVVIIDNVAESDNIRPPCVCRDIARALAWYVLR